MGIFRRSKPVEAVETSPEEIIARITAREVEPIKAQLADVLDEYALFRSAIEDLVRPGRRRVTRGEIRSKLALYKARLNQLNSEWE